LAKNSLLIAILNPLVFELRQGPLLVLFINPLAQELTKHLLALSLNNAFTLARDFRYFPAGKEMWLSIKNVETAGRQVQFETNSQGKTISCTDKMRLKIDSSPGRRDPCQ